MLRANQELAAVIVGAAKETLALSLVVLVSLPFYGPLTVQALEILLSSPFIPFLIFFIPLFGLYLIRRVPLVRDSIACSERQPYLGGLLIAISFILFIAGSYLPNSITAVHTASLALELVGYVVFRFGTLFFKFLALPALILLMFPVAYVAQTYSYHLVAVALLLGTTALVLVLNFDLLHAGRNFIREFGVFGISLWSFYGVYLLTQSNIFPDKSLISAPLQVHSMAGFLIQSFSFFDSLGRSIVSLLPLVSQYPQAQFSYLLSNPGFQPTPSELLGVVLPAFGVMAIIGLITLRPSFKTTPFQAEQNELESRERIHNCRPHKSRFFIFCIYCGKTISSNKKYSRTPFTGILVFASFFTLVTLTTITLPIVQGAQPVVATLSVWGPNYNSFLPAPSGWLVNNVSDAHATWGKTNGTLLRYDFVSQNYPEKKEYVALLEIAPERPILATGWRQLQPQWNLLNDTRTHLQDGTVVHVTTLQSQGTVLLTVSWEAFENFYVGGGFEQEHVGLSFLSAHQAPVSSAQITSEAAEVVNLFGGAVSVWGDASNWAQSAQKIFEYSQLWGYLVILGSGLAMVFLFVRLRDYDSKRSATTDHIRFLTSDELQTLAYVSLLKKRKESATCSTIHQLSLSAGRAVSEEDTIARVEKLATMGVLRPTRKASRFGIRLAWKSAFK